MLDRNEPLGTICPTILETSEYEKEGFSVIALALSLDDDDFEKLKETLVTLDKDMLLFTRRLRRIEAFSKGKLLVSLECSISPNSVATITTLRRKSESKMRYIRLSFECQGLPHHERRQGGTSKILLAFPFDAAGAVIEHQNIFAFLPLRRSVFSVRSPFRLTDRVVPHTRGFSH